MSLKIFLISILLVAVLIAAQPKLAVYGFRSQTFSSNDIASLNSILESALIDLGYFKVLTREDIKLILKERKLSSTGLVEPEDFGKMIGAKYVVFGNVDRSFGKAGYATASVKIIDIDSGEIVFAEVASVPMAEVGQAIKEMVSKIGYGKGGVYKKKSEALLEKVKPEKVKETKKEEGTFFSVGAYYIYYEDEYGDQVEGIIPMLRLGARKGGTAYGVNLYLGGFYRRYLGVFYGEVGTILLLIPYIEGGIKLGPLELSVFDVVFPGVSLTFTF